MLDCKSDIVTMLFLAKLLVLIEVFKFFIGGAKKGLTDLRTNLSNSVLVKYPSASGSFACLRSECISATLAISPHNCKMFISLIWACATTGSISTIVTVSGLPELQPMIYALYSGDRFKFGMYGIKSKSPSLRSASLAERKVIFHQNIWIE